MDSIDKLLAQIKAEYDSEQPKQPQPKPNVPNVGKPFSPPANKSASFIDNLLTEVQADVAAQDQAEESRKQQEIEQERIRQEQIKAKQREGLKKQAQDWLTKLDPFSPEGLWFERFAESYSSKLEAAIEYLQTH
ncbi:salt stress protein, Slr1339 family [Anabaena sp. CCY 9402-a]|uniref:salt stress protein, Slr1339 family n=1 Tax=Anabaena sp. CCY 9402-a TaxID=3103867 RepID=UPI0039C6DED9